MCFHISRKLSYELLLDHLIVVLIEMGREEKCGRRSGGVGVGRRGDVGDGGSERDVSAEGDGVGEIVERLNSDTSYDIRHIVHVLNSIPNNKK